MTWLWIILGIVLFFFILLALRVRLKVDFSSYTDSSLTVKAGAGPVMITLIPSKEKKRKKPCLLFFTQEGYLKKLKRKRLKAKKKALEKRAKDKAKEIEKKTASRTIPLSERIESVFEIVSFAAEEFPTLLSFVHTKIRYLHIVVGGEDAAQTAKKYGGVSIAVCAFIDLLTRATKYTEPKDGTVTVASDFISEISTADIGFSMSISVFSVLRVGLHTLKWYIVRQIKNENKNNKNTKQRRQHHG